MPARDEDGNLLVAGSRGAGPVRAASKVTPVAVVSRGEPAGAVTSASELVSGTLGFCVTCVLLTPVFPQFVSVSTCGLPKSSVLAVLLPALFRCLPTVLSPGVPGEGGNGEAEPLSKCGLGSGVGNGLQ